MTTSKGQGLKELSKSMFDKNQFELEDFFGDPTIDNMQMELAYTTGYRTGKGLEPEGNIGHNEHVSNKFQSHYIDGFMVGIGERNSTAK